MITNVFDVNLCSLGKMMPTLLAALEPALGVGLPWPSHVLLAEETIHYGEPANGLIYVWSHKFSKLKFLAFYLEGQFTGAAYELPGLPPQPITAAYMRKRLLHCPAHEWYVASELSWSEFLMLLKKI